MNNNQPNLLSTLLQSMVRTPIQTNTNIQNSIDAIVRYNRNIEDYNRNIEQYNDNIRNIIPILQDIVSVDTNPTVGQTEPVDVGVGVFPMSGNNFTTFLMSLLDVSGATLNRGLSAIDVSMNTTQSIYEEPTPHSEEPHLCPITMEPLTTGTYIMRITRCGHIFKTAALMRWFENHNTCPVCRQNPTIR
jgi:hypothetical protein